MDGSGARGLVDVMNINIRGGDSGVLLIAATASGRWLGGGGGTCLAAVAAWHADSPSSSSSGMIANANVDVVASDFAAFRESMLRAKLKLCFAVYTAS